MNEQWTDTLGFNGMILDPDGFDRSNWKYAWTEELMSEDEYLQKVSRCTIYGSKIYEYTKVFYGK
jgi:hypothetical protein